MDNKFMLNRNRYGCMRACANCPFVQKNTYPYPNNMQTSSYNQMRYTLYDNHIEEMVSNFRNQMPQTIFWNDNNGVCHTRYEWLQDYLLEYCRGNYPWKSPIYLESSSGQAVLASDSISYEKIIKEIFKTAIDIATEVTKDKNPLVSIMFDEIGLVLADDIIEAVRKVISILDKCYNQINTVQDKRF